MTSLLTRERVLWLGLALLGLSLLVNAVLAAQQPQEPFGDLAAVQVLGWFGSASLFTGAGLTVAGVVLRALDEPEPVEDEPDVDHYAS